MPNNSAERLAAVRASIVDFIESGGRISMELRPGWMSPDGEPKAVISRDFPSGKRAKGKPAHTFEGGKFEDIEIEAVLAELGRCRDLRTMMPWQIALEPTEAHKRDIGRLIGDRLRQARVALGLQPATFYGSGTGIRLSDGRRWERDGLLRTELDNRLARLARLAEQHSIPFPWISGLDVAAAGFDRAAIARS